MPTSSGLSAVCVRREVCGSMAYADGSGIVASTSAQGLADRRRLDLIGCSWSDGVWGKGGDHAAPKHRMRHP